MDESNSKIMKRTDKKPHDPILRAAAETQLAKARELDAQVSQGLLHELQVHQIELEMQNENLQEAQAALEESRDRYVDLYDFAPVGYLTLSPLDGLIVKANLAAATLLGIDRSQLVGRRFVTFIAGEDRDRWHRQFVRDGQPGAKESLEFGLAAQAGRAISVQVNFQRNDADTVDREIGVTLTDLSERKRVEAAAATAAATAVRQLRESEARLERAIKGANDGLWDWNLATGEGYISPRWKELLGYRGDEPITARESFFAQIHPEDAPSLLNMLQAHLMDRKPYNIDTRIRCKDGKYRWINSRGQAIWDERGLPVTMAGFISDISERKQAEIALTEEMKKFRSLFDAISDAAFFIDIETSRYIHVNRAACERHGYSEEELLSMGPQDICAPEFAAGVPGRIKTLTERGELVFESAQVSKDGVVVPVEINAKVVNLMGKPVIVAIARNIAARKETEAQMRKLAQAVEQSPECIVITNMDAEIEYVNEAFVSTTGYSREELIGANPRILRSGKTPPANYASLWEALTLGIQWQGELFNRRKDGTEFIEFARIAPIRQADGKITHYLAIKENITERKRIETQLAERDNDLRMVMEESHHRLAAFAGEQIRSIEAERLRLAREVHDQIGQVFTAIKLIANSISREAFPPGQEAAISQALDMGIATTRKITSELRPPLLDDLGFAAALEHLSKSSARIGNLSCEVDIDAQTSINASQGLTLFRIAQEAITNILRHAGATHFAITGRKDGVHYVFCIEDDGCGIASTGLREDSMGLVNMRERALLIGGRCEISARPQGGTLVTVSLPLGDNGSYEYTAA